MFNANSLIHLLETKQRLLDFKHVNITVIVIWKKRQQNVYIMMSWTYPFLSLYCKDLWSSILSDLCLWCLESKNETLPLERVTTYWEDAHNKHLLM